MSYQLDSFQLDTLTLDGIPSAAPPGPADEFSYAGFGLQNSQVITQKVTVSPPSNAMVERAFPRHDGEYPETSYSRRTVIQVTGSISAPTREQMEALMDQLAQAMATRGGTFKRTTAGAARYYDQCYPLSLENLFAKRDHYHATWCPFEATLVCVTPFARSERRSYTDIPFPATAPATIYSVLNSGTAKTFPQWTMTVISETGMSSLSIANASTGEGITITAAFNAGDSISVDGEAKTVTLNGSAVDYEGVIPSAIPGYNDFTLSISGAAFEVSVSERHYDRWL